MNHFILPQSSGPDAAPTRFGAQAMQALIDSLIELGARRDRIVAKVFGASMTVPGLGGPNGVARTNADFVVRFLEEAGIPLVAKKLGADLPLVVHFETATGRAFVRSVDGAHIDRIASEERDRLAMLGGLPGLKAPLLP